jgi:hypothetical protein
MDNTRTVTDAKQQKIKIKKDVITSSMSTIVDRTCYVFFIISFGLEMNFHTFLSSEFAFPPKKKVFNGYMIFFM